MVIDGQIVDAVVTDAEGNVKKSSAIMIPLKRHPLMEGIEREYVKELQEEADLDKALGLSNQLKMDELDMIRHDIDELTSSKEFVEVTEMGLQKVFEWDKLHIKCAIQNVITVLGVFRVPIISMIVGMALIFIATHHKPTLIPILVAGSALVTLMTISLIMIIVNGQKIITLDTRWNREDIRATTSRLPKAAKIKVKEAMDSQLFIRFDIVHPTLVAKESRIGLPEYNADPGVVGVTADNRQFLIVCWDIANDRVKVNPKKLSALKLKQKMSSRRTFGGLNSNERSWGN